MATDRNQPRAPTLVLHKITEILDVFSVEAPEPTLQQIIHRTRLPSSTCQRLVQDMVHEGLLDRAGDRYRIGISLVRWSVPGTLGLDVVQLVSPILRDLRDVTGETACLYVRDGGFRTVVAVAETRHVVMRPFMVGMVMPLHAGAPGKVFLAFDPQAWTALAESDLVAFTPDTPTSLQRLHEQVADTKRLGYYAAFGERNSDVGSISAPVFNHVGVLAGVLGLGFPAQRVMQADVARLGPMVVDAAAEASKRLGFDPRTHTA